jgi:hypothetical protein
MKNLLLILITVILCSCEEPTKQQESITSAKKIGLKWTTENGHTYEEQFTVIAVDSCEYLFSQYDRSASVTHKGNCKFCIERNKK